MSYEKLLTHFRGYLVGRSYYDAQVALTMMMDAMEGEFRKDGVTPSWAHPVEVANKCRTLAIPQDIEEDLLIVAILHYVLEECDSHSSELREHFKDILVTYVEMLTKKKGMSTELYYSGINKVIPAIAKGSDRWHNLSTMVGVFSPEKIKDYIVESEEHVLPMLKKAKRYNPRYEAVFEGLKRDIVIQLGFAKAVIGYTDGMVR